jgi:hypothetical protein
MKKLFLFSASVLFCGQIFAAPTPQQIEFFESKIRPILAQECYECHSSATKKKGGLVLDFTCRLASPVANRVMSSSPAIHKTRILVDSNDQA